MRICFVPTAKDWGLVMRDLGIDEPYPSAAGRVTTVCHRDHDDRIFISLGDACDRATWSSLVGIMAHECVHVAQRVKDAINGKLGREPEAYLVQALLVWLLDEYRKAGRGWRDE